MCQKRVKFCFPVKYVNIHIFSHLTWLSQKKNRGWRRKTTYIFEFSVKSTIGIRYFSLWDKKKLNFVDHCYQLWLVIMSVGYLIRIGLWIQIPEVLPQRDVRALALQFEIIRRINLLDTLMAYLRWQTVSSKHLQWRTMTISQHITEHNGTDLCKLRTHRYSNEHHTPVAMDTIVAVFSVWCVIRQNKQMTVGTFPKCTG
jgi:hypothetical protein